MRDAEWLMRNGPAGFDEKRMPPGACVLPLAVGELRQELCHSAIRIPSSALDTKRWASRGSVAKWTWM